MAVLRHIYCPPAGDRSGRGSSRKRTPKTQNASVRHGAQQSLKEQSGGSPRPGSPRRKSTGHGRLQEEQGKQERRVAGRTHQGKKKRNGRTSFRQHRAPSKKHKDGRRNEEETWKQLKKHRCVGPLLGTCFLPKSSLSFPHFSLS